MKLKCDFCYLGCVLSEGQNGRCGIRVVENGRLHTKGYGDLVGMAVDPVEKKPLYHFLPGKRTFSLAMFGCNLTCSFCQNYSISQKQYFGLEPGRHEEPKQVIELAKRSGCPSISFTYSEPLVWQDYMCEVAQLAKAEGLATIMVTNGTFSSSAIHRILPLIDAFNIDLKGDESYYRRICGGSLKPVQEAIASLMGHHAHLEVTTMVIEAEHTVQMIMGLGELLKESGVQVWHLSRYFPRYKATMGATSDQYLNGMLEIAEQYVPYVYAGNSALKQQTVCPSCKTTLVEGRDHGRPKPVETFLDGRCPVCRSPIYGIWKVGTQNLYDKV